MIRGLDVSSAGMLAQQQRYDSVANNLANVSTAGYRRQITAINSFAHVLGNVTLPPVMPPFPFNPEPASLPRMLNTVAAVDTQNGKVRKTGVSTDLALQGDGYFTIQTPTGEVYTRNGAFTLAEGGKLITQDGYQVMGEQGPITITNADWRVTPRGDVEEDGKVTNRLKLLTLDPADATRAGSTSWKTANITKAAQISVTQGSLEESNVNPVMEMINMITATRTFEANQRVVQAIDSTLDRAVNDIAR